MRILKILKLAPLVTLALSCATGAISRPRAGEADVKRVDRSYEFASEYRWRNSGYYRIDDPPGSWPWFIVISGNTACPSWDHEVYVPVPGDYYHCKTSWRIWRAF